MKISTLEKGKMRMHWNEILVLTLLSELVGPERAKEKYKLSPLEKDNENICHFYGGIEKIGQNLFVHLDYGEKIEIHMAPETKVERRLNCNKKVHVFAKKQGHFDTVLIISDNLYGLVSAVEGVEEKFVLLQEYLKLRADHQRIVYEFLVNPAFRKAMILFLGFVASNKLEKFYGFCEDFKMLAEEFNSSFARNLNISPVDYLYAETLLSDMIGDILFLNPNAVTPFYSWPHLLAANSLIKGCSVWQFAHDTVGEVLLNKSDQPFIPIYFLTAVLSDKAAEKLVQELTRYGKGKKKECAGEYIVHIVRNKLGISHNSLKTIEKFLFEKGVPDYILPDLHYLKKENTNAWEHILRYITRRHGEEYANLLSEINIKE